MVVSGKFLFFGWHKTDRSRGTDPENPGFFRGGEERIFSGFSFRSLKKMSLIADKLYRVSVVSSRRERFFNLFFRVRSCNFFMCACFFLFVCTCARICAYTRPREIHNVGLFPSVFPAFKKCSPAICSYSVIYKKIFKFSAKKYCIKVAEAEKVRTFATAFERESRWEWQTGEERQTFKGAAPEYLTLQDGKGARNG